MMSDFYLGDLGLSSALAEHFAYLQVYISPPTLVQNTKNTFAYYLICALVWLFSIMEFRTEFSKMVKIWVSTEAHYSSKAIFRIESLLFYHLFCWFEFRLNVTITILSVWMGRNTALDDCSALQEKNLRVHIFLFCKKLKFSSDYFYIILIFAQK